MKTVALIMAGGRGERFWPKSRKKTPKQFLCLTDSDRTMIQSTVDRILPLVQLEDIFFVTNQEYKDLVLSQLPGLPEENVLCEPATRNTAPCIGWGALAVQKKYGGATMIVLPSDHLISQPHLFRNVLREGVELAQASDALVTLGIAPTGPDTGYGYIQLNVEEQAEFRNAFRVRRFVEKPALDTAKAYVASGEYLWNSGMFIWKASAILREIETHLPEHAQLLRQVEAAREAGDEKALAAAFTQLTPISIDYGVMEKAQLVYVIPSSFGWDDVGSWLAVERMNTANDAGNVISGDVISVSSQRCIVQGDQRLIALVGMEDAIIVDTADALLVCAKDSAGEIKKVLEVLRAVNRTELL
ncbi:MAG: mannose-1-phosphate guanylyltransferase [Clostridia bacterium]|nr:mannose-1-phosphate guanylyltransferase [Clostridia bacterium]